MTSAPSVVQLGSVIACLALGACMTTADSPKPLPSSGTVLAERSEDLGFGFREVARSQVNPPGAFEGVGHFVFVYFREEKVCQCSRRETVLSPDGALLIYTDVVGGNLMLFRTGSRERVTLTHEYVGYPASAVWDLPAKRAVITLSHSSKKSVTVPL